MKELKPIEESWNKKRIFLGLSILVILIASLVTFKILVLDKNQNFSQGLVKKTATAIKGANTSVNTPKNDSAISGLKINIQDQINAIKQEASGIDIAEIATSSPQVQKVLKDIQAIQNLPKDKAKSFCEQVCSGL